MPVKWPIDGSEKFNLLESRARSLGGVERPRLWPAFGGNPSLPWWPRKVILANAASALDVSASYRGGMTVLRSVVLFVLAALAEIGGAWLVWQGVHEQRGLGFVGAGILALGLYGLVATFQPDPHFGRILAAYGGVFVAGSLAWGIWSTAFGPTATTYWAPPSAWQE
jgi:small multidrug resistance family-3 protein